MHEIWRMVQQLLLNYFKDINFHNDCIRMKWKLCVGFWCTCMCVLLFLGGRGVGGGRYQSDKFSVLRFQRTSINLACMLFNGMQSAWGFVRTRWYCIACMYAFTISVSELILIYQFKGLEVFLIQLLKTNHSKSLLYRMFELLLLNYYDSLIQREFLFCFATLCRAEFAICISRYQSKQLNHIVQFSNINSKNLHISVRPWRFNQLEHTACKFWALSFAIFIAIVKIPQLIWSSM